MRPLILVLLLVTSLTNLACNRPWPAFGAQVQGPPPNVLFFLTDDQRFDTLEYMPTVRRELMARGVTFTNAYVTTPLCCPSRASILTGLYARHHGVLDNNGERGGYNAFDPSSTLATWLRSAGIRTMLVGKYLNEYKNYDIPPGWDEWFAVWDTDEHYYNYKVNDGGRRRVFGYREEWYSTDVLTDQAIKVLQDKQDRPFFLFLPYTSPHGPAQPAKRDAGSFDETPLTLRPSYNEADVRDKASWIRDIRPLGEQSEGEMDKLRRNSLASLQSVDQGVGRVVETLRADGRLDNTWVIFMSDNGLSLGEHRVLERKSCGYEECVKVPLIVVPPAAQAARLSVPRSDDRLMLNIDLAPTIAAIAGATPGRPMDGVNILPHLADPTTPWRTEGVLELWTDEPRRSYQGLRADRWKYLRYGNGEQELFDLAADPYEMDSQAGNPTYAETLSSLSARLDVLLATEPR